MSKVEHTRRWCILDASGGKEAIPMRYENSMLRVASESNNILETLTFNTEELFDQHSGSAFEILDCPSPNGDAVEFRRIHGSPFNMIEGPAEYLNNTLTDDLYISNTELSEGIGLVVNGTSCHEDHLFKLTSDGSIQIFGAPYFLKTYVFYLNAFFAPIQLDDTIEWAPDNLKETFDSTNIVSTPPPTIKAFLQYIKTLIGGFPWRVPIKCRPYYFPGNGPPPSPPPLPPPPSPPPPSPPFPPPAPPASPGELIAPAVNSLFVFRRDVDNPDVIARAFENLFSPILSHTSVSCFQKNCGSTINKEQEVVIAEDGTDLRSVNNLRTVQFTTFFPEATLDEATRSVEEVGRMDDFAFFERTGFFPDEKSFTDVVVATRGALSPPAVPPPPLSGGGGIAWTNQTIWVITIASAAVGLGLLLVCLTYILTPQRATLLRGVLGSVGGVISAVRGGTSSTTKKDDTKQEGLDRSIQLLQLTTLRNALEQTKVLPKSQPTSSMLPPPKPNPPKPLPPPPKSKSVTKPDAKPNALPVRNPNFASALGTRMEDLFSLSK